MGLRKPLALILVCLLLMPHALAEDLDQSLNDLKDSDSNVRYEAVYSLLQMAENGQLGDPQVVNSLIEALQDKDSGIVRSYAAQALAYLEDPRAIEPLVKALKDKDQEVRSNAAWAMGWIACSKQVDSSVALDPLIEALNDEYNLTRSHSAVALGCLNDPKAIAPLIESLKDENETVRSDASEALKKLGIQPKIENASIRKSFFKTSNWGSFWAANYLGEKYFVAYGRGFLCNISHDTNLTKTNQLSSILCNDHNRASQKGDEDGSIEKTITSSHPIQLEEGYIIDLKYVDKIGDKAYVELSKNGSKVDSAIVEPSVSYAASRDIGNGYYNYSIKTGDSRHPLIYVHFRNSFRGDKSNFATVDWSQQVPESQHSTVPIENNKKRIISSGEPLRLEDGYELAIKGIDISSNKIYLELSKNGQVLDSRVIFPPNIGPESYTYRINEGGSGSKDIISVHFRSSFRGKDLNLSIVDGIRQASETQPSNVILEDNQRRVIAIGSPLQLKEGYELRINSIDVNGNKLYVELFKDGKAIDSALIVPANEKSDTYQYLMNTSGSEDRRFISVHFKNALSGENYSLATIDGINQISEIQPSNAILIDNKKKVLSAGSSIRFNEGYELSIKSIDLKGNKVYVELYKDGKIVDRDILKPSDDGPETYVYSGNRSETSKEELISVHFENSFSGIDKDIVTVNNILQMSESQPNKIIYNYSDKIVFDNLTPLKLKEGYELAIKSIDDLGEKVYIELSKNGQILDSAIIKPPEANDDDKTYAYTKDLGDAKSIAIIAVHFKNCFRGLNSDIATVDGVWQISENPITKRNKGSSRQGATTSMPNASSGKGETIVPQEASLRLMPSNAQNFNNSSKPTLYALNVLTPNEVTIGEIFLISVWDYNRIPVSDANLFFNDMAIGETDKQGNMKYSSNITGLNTIRAVKSGFESNFTKIFVDPINISESPVAAHNVKALVPAAIAAKVDRCILGLKDPNSVARSGAANCLGINQDPRAVEPLIYALNDSDSKVRWEAVHALGEINAPRAVESLILTLKEDKSNEVRAEAALVLGKLRDAKSIDQLTQASKDKSSLVRSRVADALGIIKGERASDLLVLALSDKVSDVRIEAAFALGEIKDPKALDPLIRALKDENSTVRYWAAWALGEINDLRAIEPLTQILELEQDSQVRNASAKALEKLRSPARTSETFSDDVQRYIKDLTDQDPGVRSSAANALGNIHDRRAIEPLIRALNDKDSGVRREATYALGKIKDARVTEPLINMLQDENSTVRYWAALGLGEINESRAVESLILTLKEDKSNWVRAEAASALAQIGDMRASDSLIQALKDNNDSVRTAAAGAFECIRDPRAVEPLIQALKDEDKYVRDNAASALSDYKDPRAVEPLIQALNDEYSQVRMRSAYSLGSIKDPRAVYPLILKLADNSSDVRTSAAYALGEIGDIKAVDPLTQALNDGNNDVRNAAAEALKKLASPTGQTATTNTTTAATIGEMTTAITTGQISPEEEWNKTFGGPADEEGEQGQTVQQTVDGGYIITGSTSSYGAGGYDIWLIRTDKDGKELWNKTFGGSKSDWGNSVQQTSDGGFIVAGYTWSYGAGESDAWLIKTDATGKELWNKTFGGSGGDSGDSVQQTNDGGYIISGGTESFGNDAWLIKTDENGNELWNKTLNYNVGYGGVGFFVQQTTDGGYMVCGVIEYYHKSAAWMSKTDATGKELWNIFFDKPNDCQYVSGQQTSDGGYIIAGSAMYPNETLETSLTKIDANGNKLWNKTIGVGSNSIRQTDDGGYIITGLTGFGKSPNRIYKATLIKTDSNGDELWDKTLGGSRMGSWVQQTADGGFIIVGKTDTLGVGHSDIWLIKLRGTQAT